MTGEHRIRVVGGPWPERIGLTGHVVKDPGDGIYPFSGRAKGEIIIFIDDDPLNGHYGDYWTCAIGINDVVDEESYL
jgi:hypothetical protein